MISGFTWLKTSDEITRAGRILVVVRSVNGKATRTTSPRLKTVIDSVLRIVPKSERLFGRSKAEKIILGKMNQGRQVTQELPLFLRFQRPDGFFNHFQSHVINITHPTLQINAISNAYVPVRPAGGLSRVPAGEGIIGIVLFLFCSLLCLNAHAATHYIDFAAGSDSNNGTSMSTPWKRAPGMAGFAGAYSHQAGDRFIFKGGVTWTSSALPLNISAGGASGSPDYYGVDTTWFSGASFTRPIFDGGYAVANTITVGSVSNVTIDNLELRYVSSSSNYGYGLISGGAPSFLTISHCYLHGWRTTSATDDAHGGVIFTSFGPNVDTVVFDSGEIENAENSSRWNGVMFREIGAIRNSLLHDNSSAVLFTLDFDHNIIHNICSPQCGFDGNYHWNGVYLDAETLGKSVGYIRNSVFYDIDGGANMSYLNGRHATLYNYNNVYYGQISAQRAIEIEPYDYGANQTSGVYNIYNNTGFLEDGTPLVHIVDRNGVPQPSSIVLRNNHVVGTSVSVDDNGPSAGYTRSNNLIQTASVAGGQGYTVANQGKPTLSSVATVDTGFSGSALFTTDKDGIARPQGAAWDIGAYEFTTSVPPPPSSSACDVNKDNATNIVDVQQCVNQSLGVATCTADINKDGICNVVDVQRVVNAALGGQCVTQ